LGFAHGADSCSGGKSFADCSDYNLHTGIVDQDVQMTLGFLDMFFCGDDRLDVGHVEAEELDIKILVF